MRMTRAFLFTALCLTLGVSSPVVAVRVLKGANVVGEEDVRWLREESGPQRARVILDEENDEIMVRRFAQGDMEDDSISVQEFIGALQGHEELESVEVLNLRGTPLDLSSLNTLKDGLLPLLPNLKVLDLYCCGLRTQDDIDLIASVIQSFDGLQYINLVANAIAREVVNYVQSPELQSEVVEGIKSKVIFSFNTSLETQFPDKEQDSIWYDTHKSYYDIENPYRYSFR